MVWCLLYVVINCTVPASNTCEGDTAVQGKVVKDDGSYYFVDFSEYAKKQKYVGDWSAPRLVDKDKCMEDK